MTDSFLTDQQIASLLRGQEERAARQKMVDRIFEGQNDFTEAEQILLAMVFGWDPVQQEVTVSRAPTDVTALLKRFDSGEFSVSHFDEVRAHRFDPKRHTEESKRKMRENWQDDSHRLARLLFGAKKQALVPWRTTIDSFREMIKNDPEKMKHKLEKFEGAGQIIDDVLAGVR